LHLYSISRGSQCRYAYKIENGGIRDPFDQGSKLGGKRKYFVKKDMTAQHRIQITTSWAAKCRARLQNEDQQSPLPRPLVEVGYASALKRLDQHQKHQSSNYLMNLTEAICKVEFPDFFIKQFVVFHIFDVTHAMFGEIIISRLAQAYVSHGGGFCHFMAGVSHRGAKEMKEVAYRELRQKVFQDPIFIKTM